jgi:hypothetical protein
LIAKRREQCILLLDDCFDSSVVHNALTQAGFVIERFTAHFPRQNNPGLRESGVKDSRVISLCAQHGFLLVTTDCQMKRTFAEELKKTDIGVVATSNNQDGIQAWIQALIKAKAQILRDFKKQERPYFSILSKKGKLNTENLRNRTTRRTRPQEKERPRQQNEASA